MIGDTFAPASLVLQTAEAQGGPAPIVAAALLALALGFLLSLWIAWRLFAGYRGSGDRSMLALATGLVLLTTVPTTIRVVVPTTTGGASELRIVAASASELAGLLVVLLAIRTPARRRHRVRHERLLLLLPAQAVLERGLDWLGDHVGVVAPGVTAVVGAYVGWQAYRGYRRNDSAPMGWLAAGIVLLTVVPVVTSVTLVSILGLSDATGLLSVSLSQLGGLLAILYSLLRT